MKHLPLLDHRILGIHRVLTWLDCVLAYVCARERFNFKVSFSLERALKMGQAIPKIGKKWDEQANERTIQMIKANRYIVQTNESDIRHLSRARKRAPTFSLNAEQIER